LRAAGYTTGLYTSPHLIDRRERIRINGEPLEEDVFTQIVRTIQPVADELTDSRQFTTPTFFEIYTAMGLLAFAQAKVDVAIVEVGLGGRLDATNIIKPQLAVITTIGLDHTRILGDTLAAIAGEKAGIIKPHVPVVCAPQQAEAAAVIQQRAAELQAPFIPVVRLPHIEMAGPAPVPPPEAPFCPPVQHLVLRGGNGQLHVHTPLVGRHQAVNAATAHEVVLQLRRQGWHITDGDIERGLANVRWPGRFDVREARPWLVLDCAHNEPSAAALAAALPEHLQFDRLVLVMGVSRDKNVEAMARWFAPLAGHVILTEARLHRAMPVADLAQRTEGIWQVKPECIVHVRAALDRARRVAGPRDCICITGSFFVVGEAMAYLQGLPEEYR